MQIQVQSAEKLKPIPPSQKLGFGQHFSDHWLRMRYTAGAWGEPSIEPYGPLALDPAASVFHYGQALFEGMKAFRRTDGSIWFFRPEFNAQRMIDGAARLCLEAPTASMFLEAVRELVKVDARWVPSEEGCSLYIRPTLIGAEPFLGVRPSREIIFFILLSPVGSYYSGGSAPVRIWVEEGDLRAAPGGLGAVKAGANYAASLRAAAQAREKGYSQVLWLDATHESIEEVGTMNVFFVIEGEVVTPALNGSILPGGVRDSAIRILRKKGLRVIERKIGMAEVAAAHARGTLQEAFGTGTAAVVTPIGEFHYQDRALPLPAEGPIGKELFKFITDLQRGRIADEFGWMKPLESLGR